MSTTSVRSSGSKPTIPEELRPPSYSSTIQKCMPFVIGGASGMIATVCIQPIDMVKVRMQLQADGAPMNPILVARNIIAQGRIRDLYSGLSAGLLRQVVYGTTRLGLFFTFEDMLKARAERRGTQVTIGQRGLAALGAGGLGAMIGNSTEVILIRMQSDGSKPVAQRQSYRSIADASVRIVKQEGVFAFWNGSSPTIVRAMAVNLGQLATFSEAKHHLTKLEGLSEQMRTVSASAIAGFFAAFLSLPFDFVKTRLQSQSKGFDGAQKYKGT